MSVRHVLIHTRPRPDWVPNELGTRSRSFREVWGGGPDPVVLCSGVRRSSYRQDSRWETWSLCLSLYVVLSFNWNRLQRRPEQTNVKSSPLWDEAGLVVTNKLLLFGFSKRKKTGARQSISDICVKRFTEPNTKSGRKESRDSSFEVSWGDPEENQVEWGSRGFVRPRFPPRGPTPGVKRQKKNRGNNKIYERLIRRFIKVTHKILGHWANNTCTRRLLSPIVDLEGGTSLTKREWGSVGTERTTETRHPPKSSEGNPSFFVSKEMGVQSGTS